MDSPKYQTIDANMATAMIGYNFSDMAFVYPITPSSPMAVYQDVSSLEKKKNLFGAHIKVLQMQSEMGVAAAINGAMTAGALATTYTCSQGLALMVPSMYKMAGFLYPGVIHVASRTLWSVAGSLAANHADIMATSKTGYCLMASTTVQESHDLAAISHLASTKGCLPFVHFFSGMRVSHEINKIRIIPDEVLSELMDREAIENWRKNSSLRNTEPMYKGAASSDQYWMQMQEAVSISYIKMIDIVDDYMKKFAEKTGRKYNLFDYEGHPEAEIVIVSMGHIAGTIAEVVTHLQKTQDAKVGAIAVRLFRPWSVKHLLDVLPATVKKIAVIDMSKEPGSQAEPLYLDVSMSVANSGRDCKVYGGRGGFGGKHLFPGDVFSVIENLKKHEPKNNFTLGIIDDLCDTALPTLDLHSLPAGTVQSLFYGLAADGTVGANKTAIKLIGENTDQWAQGYFVFDAKKSGGLTTSHLRFGPEEIRAEYEIEDKCADYVAVHHPSFIQKFDVARKLKKGGIFVLNTNHCDPQSLSTLFPETLKKDLAEREATVYVIDAFKVAQENNLGVHINMVMQSVFFSLANVLPVEKALELLKNSVKTMYKMKGDAVVQQNLAAVDSALKGLTKITIPDAWKSIETPAALKPIYHGNFYLDKIAEPVAKFTGDDVITVKDARVLLEKHYVHSSRQEKRGVALTVPEWNKGKCIQCTACAMVCPHASIRPVLVPVEDEKEIPEGMEFLPAKGIKSSFGKYKFRIQISPMDCYGCGVCVNECPKAALEMKPLETQVGQQPNFDWSQTRPDLPEMLDPKSVKGSQLQRPYVEFSGACAGCCETPYMKLITQLWGDHLYVANATGCSMIWAGFAPSIAYTSWNGRGPAFESTLFENDAEFGFGMTMALYNRRNMAIDAVKRVVEAAPSKEVVELANSYLENTEDAAISLERGNKLVDALTAIPSTPDIAHVINEKEVLQKKVVWIVGGDGWAYDIGSAGVDHILASGANVNVLVLDTEVYSNTGGQISKGSSLGQVAQFAQGGKRTKKKEFALQYVMQGDCYVATVAMGGNKLQMMKAFNGAVEYDGPSLVVAYCPCIAHGIADGMGKSQRQQKLAVESGYWPLFRFDPRLRKAGKSPMSVDSKIKIPLDDFLKTELRFVNLHKLDDELANELAKKLQDDVKDRDRLLRMMAKAFEPEK